MLNKILPQNSQIRSRLQFFTRRLNFAVSSQLRKNFTQVEEQAINEFRELLLTNNCFYSEGGMDLNTHLLHRLELDRYETIPWINSVVTLSNASILEIGCGIGSSSVALAEQGANVVGIDIDAKALNIAKDRCRIYGIKNVRFVHGNAMNVKHVFHKEDFNLIIFFASLEHMTIEERKTALRAAWDMLSIGDYLCITETPNRLWFYDSHTAHMPFFHWLPDDLAFEYSSLSPRSSFNQIFRDLDSESMLSFFRCGRGVSFHDFDLALGKGHEYSVVSDRSSFLARHNPVKLLKRILAGDGRRERLLNSYARDRHRAFFKENLDLILLKLA